MKICFKCKKELPLDQFAKNKLRLNSYCKTCQNLYRKEYYKNNIIYHKKKNKRRIYELRKLLNEYKKTLGGCQICDEKDYICLDFHHRIESDKSYNIGEMVANRCGWNRILKEIEKCDILCANCHRKLHRDKRKSAD